MAQTIPDRSTVWIKDPEKDSAESFVKSTVRWSRAALHMRCTRARSARSLHVHCTFTVRSLHTHRARSFLPGRGYIVTTPDGQEKTLRPVDVAMANPAGMVRPDNSCCT